MANEIIDANELFEPRWVDISTNKNKFTIFFSFSLSLS